MDRNRCARRLVCGCDDKASAMFHLFISPVHKCYLLLSAQSTHQFSFLWSVGGGLGDAEGIIQAFAWWLQSCRSPRGSMRRQWDSSSVRFIVTSVVDKESSRRTATLAMDEKERGKQIQSPVRGRVSESPTWDTNNKWKEEWFLFGRRTFYSRHRNSVATCLGGKLCTADIGMGGKWRVW